MKVSLIIPVYNAAKTLRKSLDSVAMQSFRDFEVVFVNDCSTDDSRDIIEEFASTSGTPFQIIDQPNNMGVAAARNRALEVARGEYVMWVDADDLLEIDAIRIAVEAAETNDADIVGWDWTLGFEHNGRYMRQAEWKSPLDALKNLMGGTMRWNLWLFMVRRSLIQENGLRFIPGANMGEDMMFMIKAFSHCGNAVQIHQPLYRYNAVSTSSISKQFSEVRRSEVSKNLDQALLAVAESRYKAELCDYTNFLKLFIKLPLLMSDQIADYKIWYDLYPESNAYAKCNKVLPLRTRLVQWMASKKCWLGVKAYYVFVYKFVYGLIYR